MNDQLTGRHQVNIGHLVMGLALLGLVGIWALWQVEAVASDDVRWLLPVPWVVAGVVGLATTAVTGSRRHSARQTGWVGTEPGLTPEPAPDEASLDEPVSDRSEQSEPPQSDHPEEKP